MPSSTVTPTTPAAKLEPVPMLDLKRQYASIKDDISAAVERVLTTQYLIGGPELDAFEKESAAYLGAGACLGCASGTDALWLAMAAAGVKPGDRVITSPFTFFASASSITRCGATPVFADIDSATFNLDPTAVESCIAGARSHPRHHAGSPLRSMRRYGCLRRDRQRIRRDHH